jgi:hypothetical protein
VVRRSCGAGVSELERIISMFSTDVLHYSLTRNIGRFKCARRRIGGIPLSEPKMSYAKRPGIVPFYDYLK